MSTFTFKEAAHRILSAEGKPLHAHEIARRALDAGMIATTGRTPEATMEAALCVAVRARNPAFVRVAPRTFAVREGLPTADAEGTDDAPGSSADAPGDRRVRVPYFPTYSELRAFLRAVRGLTAEAVTHLHGALSDLRGTPQSQIDWSEPDIWISERLEASDAATARAIWEASGRVVNPRHTTGVWLTARNYDLLGEDSGGRLTTSAPGDSVLGGDPSDVLRDIDEAEGLLAILQLVAELGPAGTAELLAPWVSTSNDTGGSAAKAQRGRTFTSASATSSTASSSHEAGAGTQSPQRA